MTEQQFKELECLSEELERLSEKLCNKITNTNDFEVVYKDGFQDKRFEVNFEYEALFANKDFNRIFSVTSDDDCFSTNVVELNLEEEKPRIIVHAINSKFNEDTNAYTFSEGVTTDTLNEMIMKMAYDCAWGLSELGDYLYSFKPDENFEDRFATIKLLTPFVEDAPEAITLFSYYG